MKYYFGKAELLDISSPGNVYLGEWENIDDEAVFSPAQVAQLLKKSTETVRRYLRYGKMQGFGAGGYYMIKGHQFKDYIRQTSTGNIRQKKQKARETIRPMLVPKQVGKV